MAYKAKSITSKASSACKMNMGLVMGAGDMHNSKAFVDHGALMEKRLQSGKAKPVTPKEQEKQTEAKSKKTLDVPEAKGINTDLGASTDIEVPTLTFN